jgi:hypothetical protein
MYNSGSSARYQYSQWLFSKFLLFEIEEARDGNSEGGVASPIKYS